MKRTRSKHTLLSQHTSLRVACITALLSLGACSAGGTLDSESQISDLPPAPITVDQATDLPSIGAAAQVDSEPAPHSLEADAAVSCSAPIEHIQQRTIRLINEARSQSRNCGTNFFKATAPVSWNAVLLLAAQKHSVDMTQHNFFSHTGSDSSTVATRVNETGYEWRAIGENIAAGQNTAATVISGWLTSPGHCSNLMSPAFTHTAVACTEDSGADYTRYWTHVLATPQ